jgi:hypothetical protein
VLFNQHSHLEGAHALLSASKYHWVNYDDQKLEAFYTAQQAAARGTRFHELAADLIRMGVNLPRTNKTLNLYVNDALGFRMTPEVVLVYSDVSFGTTDCISFRRNKLRIHDLKMGITATKVTQLEVYAALFCLEYSVKPMDIEIELRIYQNNEIRIYPGDADMITHIMSKIIEFDRRIQNWRKEALT